MAVRGEWTSTAGSLPAFSARLRSTGQSGLKRNMTKAIRVATLPCRDAVRAELRAVMPHSGGLNEWMAKSSINSAVLTSVTSAGVVVRARKAGHDLKDVNSTGQVRHPTRAGRGWSHENRSKWASTAVPSGWWEHALEPFGPAVEAALIVSMRETAIEAGFA